MKKRGQVSYFVLVGVLLLVFFFSLNYIRNVSLERVKVDSELVNEKRFEKKPLDRYVISCIDIVSYPIIKLLMEQGGTLNLSEKDFVWYYNEKYRYFCYNQHTHGCVNAIFLRQEMEKELQNRIKQGLESCINLDVFREKGYKVDTGTLNVTVRIGVEEVRVILDYPITLKKAGSTIKQSMFSSNIDIPLGKLYALANEIVNSEIEFGFFDQNDFMMKHGAHILIEKHRPYPDIVYKLTIIGRENYSFLFALQGEDTVSLLPNLEQTRLVYGCCFNSYDGFCFKNAPKEECEKKGGTYNPNTECICPAIGLDYGDRECGDGGCKDCVATYEHETKSFTGPPRRHGESWCAYDSIVESKRGHGGMDYVGGRHYRHMCINGKEYVEECRDFREELCTEKNINGLSKAMCRPNRWQDCWLCKTRECCENSSVRDCKWSDFLFRPLPGIDYSDVSRCYPKVPPGFRFWEGNGEEVCNIATNYALCDDFSCPNVWVDHSALYCYFQGDCGNYRNIADRLTKEGFFNSDPTDSVRDYVYHQDGLNKNPAEIGRSPLHLDLYKRKRDSKKVEFPMVMERLPYLLSAAFNYLDYISDLSISDFINPFKEPPEIKVLDYSFCSLWSAPYGGEDCYLCDEDPLEPCTEYKCKSLGQLCRFELVDGVGRCFPFNTDDKEEPEIDFNTDALSPGYRAYRARLKILDKSIDGYEIEPAIKPYAPFKFGIKTNEPAKCKLAYLPNISYRFLPSVWFDKPTFSLTHNMTIRLPAGLVIPERVYYYLNITAIVDLIGIIDDLQAAYRSYRASLEDELDLYEYFTGNDILSTADFFFAIVMNIVNKYSHLFPYIKELSRILLSAFEQNTYYFFVRCKDMAGNENTEDFFIKFTINRTAANIEPPLILKIVPENNSILPKNTKQVSLKLYVNKPSECRYSNYDVDYAYMQGLLECPISSYKISPVLGGSYECTGEIPFSGNNLKLYFKCKDNPPKRRKYKLYLVNSTSFSMNKSVNMGISRNRELFHRYFNLTPPNIIAADGDLLNSNYAVNYNTSNVTLIMYIDDDMQCRFSSDKEHFEKMQGSFSQCEGSDKFDIGAFYCNTTIPLNFTDLSINIECKDTTYIRRNENKHSFVYNLLKER